MYTNSRKYKKKIQNKMASYNYEPIGSDDDEEVLTGSHHGDMNRHYGATKERVDIDIHEGSKSTYDSNSVQSYHSINRLLHTSLSVSTLAKPSDDRRNHSILAGWNVSNMIQGTGILGIPYAVQQGGWAGVIMIFLVAAICCHTGKLLIDCMYERSAKTGIRRRLRTNYPEIAEAVLGRRGLLLVGIFQSIEMFSAVVMYIILLGTGWSDIIKSSHLGLKEWAAINCAIVLPALFIRKMSIVSWFSMISVFSLMAALLVLIAFTFTQIPLWAASNIPAFDIQTFPIGFGIIVFSYCAHPVFPSVEGAMAKPTQFNLMMNCSFLLAAIVKAALGAFMVLRFGKDTAQVATVNLADHVVFSRLSTALVIVNVLLAIPLVMFVVSLSFEDAVLPHLPSLNRDSPYHWVWLAISRPFLIGFALLIAVMVPYFGLIMGVVGSLTGTSLCFLFPCYFHLRLRWNAMKLWEKIADFAIIIFGIIAGVSGLTLSLRALILALSGKGE